MARSFMSAIIPTIVRTGGYVSGLRASGARSWSGGNMRIDFPMGFSLGKNCRARASLIIATPGAVWESSSEKRRPSRRRAAIGGEEPGGGWGEVTGGAQLKADGRNIVQ